MSFNNVALAPLSTVEKKAVEAFCSMLQDLVPGEVETLGLWGLRGDRFKSSRDINILVLLKREAPELEEKVLELGLEVLLDLGVYLSLKCFHKAQYETFKALELPMIEDMQEDMICLWAA